MILKTFWREYPLGPLVRMQCVKQECGLHIINPLWHLFSYTSLLYITPEILWHSNFFFLTISHYWVQISFNQTSHPFGAIGSCMYKHMKSSLCLVTQLCLTLCGPMDCSLPGSSAHEIFFSPGKNTGVGYHFLLPGIFLTQGLSPVSPALQMAYLSAEPLGKSYDPECLISISISINSAESGVQF